MGINEAVTPPFPNSDHWYVHLSYLGAAEDPTNTVYWHSAGTIGSTAVLHALTRMSEEGGSYGVDVSELANSSPSCLSTPLNSDEMLLSV